MARHRSPNYPAHGLSLAVEFIKDVYAKEKRSQSPGEIIAKALGYNSLSGPARVKIAAMKQYGLLEGDERKGMRVSDLAMQILYPSDKLDEHAARKAAALTPELFRALYEEKHGASDEALANYLISRMNFSPGGAQQAIAAFRDTLTYAGQLELEYNTSQTPSLNEAHSMQPETRSALANDLTPPAMRFSRDQLHSPESTGSHAWSWTLSVPRRVEARLTVDGPITKADFARLKKQIEFLEGSFDDEEAAQ